MVSRVSEWKSFSAHSAIRKLRVQAFAAGIHSAAAQILTGREDRYNGFIIDPDELPEDPSAFSHKLKNSLQVGNLLLACKPNVDKIAACEKL